MRMTREGAVAEIKSVRGLTMELARLGEYTGIDYDYDKVVAFTVRAIKNLGLLKEPNDGN